MTMETKIKNEEQQWKDHVSSASSSRSSSITSESSEGHFVLRLPKPSLTASEIQKQRETHQAYSSSVSSYNSSSWSSVHQNRLMDLPGYDPNRIPSSVFSSAKPANSMEWSLASNESLFSIHDDNFTSLKEDHRFNGTFRSDEMPKLKETIDEITDINPVPVSPPLPPVQKPNQYDKEAIAEEKEKSDSESEIDDNDDDIKDKQMIEIKSNDEHVVKEEDIIEEAEILVEIETKKPKEKEIVIVVKEYKAEDSNSVNSYSPSISCRSDNSNNSVGSFAFPVLKNEDGVIKMPVMDIRNNIAQKQRAEYHLPQSPMQRLQPQAQLTQLESPQSQPEPQRMSSSKRSEFHKSDQSPKSPIMKFLSCFHCPKKCGFFK